MIKGWNLGKRRGHMGSGRSRLRRVAEDTLL